MDWIVLGLIIRVLIPLAMLREVFISSNEIFFFFKVMYLIGIIFMNIFMFIIIIVSGIWLFFEYLAIFFQFLLF